MGKEDDLLRAWNDKREQISKFLDKHSIQMRYHEIDGVNLFRLIIEYGNAQEALVVQKWKRLMIKKLEE